MAASNSDEEVVVLVQNTPIQAGSGQQTTNESVHSKNVSIEEKEHEDFSPEEESLNN